MHAPFAPALFLALLTLRAAAADWTEFRGPTGQGVVEPAGLPLSWSATENIAWKTVLPGAGWSSPVVAGGRVFVTTGVPSPSGPSLRALALDTVTGAILWNTEIFTPEETEEKPVHAKNSPASPTPLVDGDRLFVHFGHHGTASLDRDGKIVWRNNRLRYDPTHGNGGSPILAGGRLVFHADGGKTPGVHALNPANGEVVWTSPRKSEASKKFSFCTPLLITVNGKPQIVSPGSGVVSGLDPADGRVIWSARYGEGYSVVPRPVFAHGLVFLSTGYDRAELLAIRPDGAGDVTDTHIAWRAFKGAPLTPSPLVVGDDLFTVSDIGIATCWDARTGKVHYQERVEGNYSSSPVLAGDRIFLQNETGLGTVLKTGRMFEKLASNPLGERSLASYAAANGAWFIRTAGHLRRVGAPAK